MAPFCSGIDKRAKEIVEKIRELNPKYHLDHGDSAVFKIRDDRDRFIEGLKVGGMT